jgi:hypothetical protein
MNKVLLITLTLLLTSCYNQKPDETTTTYPDNHPVGAIITENNTVIFYHKMESVWNEFVEMVY